MCPRRVGKSFLLMSYALWTALTKPGSLVLMASLTLKNTKKLYWADLIAMGEAYGLGFERQGFSHSTDGWLKLDNGSIIRMAGAETMSDVERLRGPAYDLCLVDECASFNNDVFDYLLEYALMPAIMDTSGTIVVAGTPGNIMSGEFFEATYPHHKVDVANDNGVVTRQPTTRNYRKPEKFWLQGLDVEPLWSRHHWTQEDNVAKPDLWRNALRKKKAKRWRDDNPIWLQEYIGLWTPRSDSLVYALSAVVAKDLEADETPRCYYKPGTGKGYNEHGLPLGHHWRYMLGVDLGWTDATAFVVVAYSDTFPAMRVVYQHKEAEMTTGRVAAHVLELDATYDFEAQIADTGSGGRQMVESMNDEHGTDLEAASKANKAAFQRLLDSDLWDGKLQMVEDSELPKEMLALHWDLRGEARQSLLRKGKLKEDPKAENHLCDALLYVCKAAMVGADSDEDDEDDNSELTYDELQELERIKELQRRSGQDNNSPFGEGFSESMEPDEPLTGAIFF